MLLSIKLYKLTHPETYITGIPAQTYLLYVPTDTHPSRGTPTLTHRAVKAQCKIRGAVNGGGQLGCCFIKVQGKCRSLSCRMQGIGSVSFCLLNSTKKQKKKKNIPAGIQQPLPLNGDFVMVNHRKYLLTVSLVLLLPSGAQHFPWPDSFISLPAMWQP